MASRLGAAGPDAKLQVRRAVRVTRARAPAVRVFLFAVVFLFGFLFAPLAAHAAQRERCASLRSVSAAVGTPAGDDAIGFPWAAGRVLAVRGAGDAPWDAGGALRGVGEAREREPRSDLFWLSLAALGAQAVLLPLDAELRDGAQGMRGAATDAVARVAEPLGRAPVLYVVSGGALLGGRLLDAPEVTEPAVRALVSLALAHAATAVVKGVAGRGRPRVVRVVDGRVVEVAHGPWSWKWFAGWEDDARRAYPSGHAAAAFAVATVAADAWGGAAPWVAYPAAGLVAWSRVNDDAHWASDVALGAAIGVGAGRLVRAWRGGHARPDDRTQDARRCHPRPHTCAPARWSPYAAAGPGAAVVGVRVALR